MLEENMTDTNPADVAETLTLTVIHHSTPHALCLSPSASISDLSNAAASILSVPVSNQKFMISKLGLFKPPFKDPGLPISLLLDKKITLMGATIEEASALANSSAVASRLALPVSRHRQTVKAYKTHDWRKEQEESQYTFTTLRPLPYLPNPERSLAFLQRLKDDAGIKAAMRKHKFMVPLLTEMNPVEHTHSNHEGTTRTLGLNKNAGEEILLRLRTDAYDGYRDYKTIRATLCHELAHNVHGPHDRKFWDLCHQIEKDVQGSDWRSGGHTIGDQEFYDGGEDVVDDHGGWTGGAFVLGAGPSNSPTDTDGQGQDMNMREVLAKAAEERMKRLRDQDGSNSTGEGSSN